MSWKRTIDRVREELSNVSRTLTAKCRRTGGSKNVGQTAKSVPDCKFPIYLRVSAFSDDLQFFSFPLVRTSADRYWYSHWKWGLLSCSWSFDGRRNSEGSHWWLMFGATIQTKCTQNRFIQINWKKINSFFFSFYFWRTRQWNTSSAFMQKKISSICLYEN